jgi:hypothetical protein
VQGTFSTTLWHFHTLRQQVWAGSWQHTFTLRLQQFVRHVHGSKQQSQQVFQQV